VSGSQEFQTATVTGKSISTAAATHGSLVSNAETPEATSLRVPSSAPAGGAPKKMVPISVFVSRKLSKLFVRQGFSPLFDVAVMIENPEEPLGTHVFTAMESRARERLFAGPSCRFRRNFLACPRVPRKSAKRPRSKTPYRYRRPIKPTLPSTASKYPRIRLRGSLNY
jgi:hypothetical protein